MKYSELAEVYEKLEGTTKRLEKTKILSALLKKTPADDVEEMVLLLQGRIYPAWDEREIGVASKTIAKAISIASGSDLKDVNKEWKKTGDLGLVAENLVRKKKQSTLSSSELTVRKVFSNVRKLAEEVGAGSVDRKLQGIAELLTSAKPIEAKYIARTILQDLRVGVGSGALRDAIVWAYFPIVKGLFPELADEEKKCKKALKAYSADGIKNIESYDAIEADEKVAREIYNRFADAVQQAYDLTTDFAVVAKTAKTKGMKGLENVEIRIGTPIKVMLALKTDTIEEGFETVGVPADVEFKFDGFRVQIHKDKDVNVFTRRLENVTSQFPEIVEYVKKYVKARSCILDAEAVGFDPKTKHYLPFQHISQRIKRKYDIERIAKELPVEVNVFDIIEYNGKNMIREPFRKRRELIEKIVSKEERKILPARAIVTGKESEVKEFFALSKEKGNEGVMIKKLDAPYKPGARVGHMLKYKSTMENLDLVITGAEWGEGKRATWLSSYDIACKKGGEFVEIGKVSTGLKEKPSEGLSFGEMTKILKPLIISEEGKHVKIKKHVVIEVAYEEIQKSPTYASGFALRFPRVLRIRDDKGISDASTLKMVEKLYESQK